MDELNDAIIEDTVHCTVCGASWVLGGNEGAAILDPPGDMQTALEHGCEQVKLCPECVQRVVDEYKESLRMAGICEHGVNDGEWCEDCNKAYKEAQREAGYQETQGVQGVRPTGWILGPGSWSQVPKDETARAERKRKKRKRGK